MIKFLFLLLSVLCCSQSIVEDTIKLEDIVFKPEDKNRSLEIMTLVGKNAKKNYQFYQTVNYPISIDYKGSNCSENYTGEIAYNKLLNSSIVLNNLDENSCLRKELGSNSPLVYLVVTNIRWLDNWGGSFSKKRIKKAKYGTLKELDDIFYITLTKENRESSIIEIDKSTYAILSLTSHMKLDEIEKLDDDSPLKTMGDHSVEIFYEKYNGKFHPKSIDIFMENGNSMQITFDSAKNYYKLKNNENGNNLLVAITQENEAD